MWLGTHKKIFNNNSGIALLVTLAVISVLLTAALQLAKITGKSIIETRKETDEFMAREMAISGIHLAMAILADDASKNEIDSIQEDWANPEKISEAITQLGFTQGSLSLEITDELGKLQVNALLKRYPGHELNQDQQTLWENFLSLKISTDKSEDQRNPAVIINALKDWLDSQDDDAITGLSGAESDYYRQLEPPYMANNAPINQVSELLKIKGFSPDLLEMNMEPVKQTEKKTQDDPETMVPLKFEDIFTVYGMNAWPTSPKTYAYPGKININTAGIEILAALLPRGMDDLAQDLVDFRKEKSEDGETFINFLNKGWYERVIEFSEKEKGTFDRMIRYDSTLFKAECRSLVNEKSVTISAYMIREQKKKTNQWDCRIIQLTRD